MGIILSLAIEADTVTNELDISEQTYMKQVVANKFQNVINIEKTQKER
jgi:hypothetical protein